MNINYHLSKLQLIEEKFLNIYKFFENGILNKWIIEFNNYNIFLRDQMNDLFKSGQQLLFNKKLQIC